MKFMFKSIYTDYAYFDEKKTTLKSAQKFCYNDKKYLKWSILTQWVLQSHVFLRLKLLMHNIVGVKIVTDHHI
jgi:hypothetical protein